MGTPHRLRAYDIEAAFRHWPPEGHSGELCNWRFTCETTQRSFNVRELEIRSRLTGAVVPNTTKTATRVLYFVEEFVPSDVLRVDTGDAVRYEHCDEVAALLRVSPNHFFAALAGLGISADSVICQGAPHARQYRRLAPSLRACAERIAQALADDVWLAVDATQIRR